MQPLLLLLAGCCYFGAALLAVFIRPGSTPGRLSGTVLCSLAGIGVHVAFVAVRAAAIGFLPFASRFEAMLLYALAIQTASLVQYLAVPRRTVKTAADFLSAVLIAVVLLKFGFEPGRSLNPILNSPWFAVHILLAFGGYGVLTVGMAWSVAAFFDRTVAAESGMPRRLAGWVALLLGAGILTGAMWADDSWGRYWSWDPKESWALLTWLVMVAYLHLAGSRSRRWLALVGYALSLAAMLFTFIGINLLRWGMHRYR